jgi:2-polyprenyl-3-methyl-5-hydroxy-6-metoxy-1,4-benzoquinol methylase
MADARWPVLARALAELREARRRAVRIVDADCGDGALLLAAARHARVLGFVAIEVRGVDGAPALIARARAAAAALDDAAIGICFDCADMVEALAQEHDFPADIVLAPAALSEAATLALARAGARVIARGRA